MLNNFFKECGDTTPNKLKLLVSCISIWVYKYIEYCTAYEIAINLLEQLYVKTNKIFANHILATYNRNQANLWKNSCEWELHRLNKNYVFKMVTAEQYQELVRGSLLMV